MESPILDQLEQYSVKSNSPKKSSLSTSISDSPLVKTRSFVSLSPNKLFNFNLRNGGSKNFDNEKEPNFKSLLSNPLKKMVSKNKRRFVWDNYDLDLAYITQNILAMGFPSENIESIYRNSLDEVKGFLQARHPQHYRIYNLCAERKYDKQKFQGRVAQYPFQDHNAPPFELIFSCCEDIKNWLQKDQSNVAAIHCKAGKGRTGLIICCYLIYSGFCSTAAQSLQHYAQYRTLDGKGVTIQSQRRYIRYFEKALKGNIDLQTYLSMSCRYKITKITVTSCPQIQTFEMFGGCTPWISIDSNQHTYKSKYDHELQNYKAGEQFDLKINHDFEIINDFKITFFSKGQFLNKSSEFMRIWLNVKFIHKETIQVSAKEIDGVKSSDERFNMNMKVIISFQILQ